MGCGRWMKGYVGKGKRGGRGDQWKKSTWYNPRGMVSKDTWSTLSYRGRDGWAGHATSIYFCWSWVPPCEFRLHLRGHVTVGTTLTRHHLKRVRGWFQSYVPASISTLPSPSFLPQFYCAFNSNTKIYFPFIFFFF